MEYDKIGGWSQADLRRFIVNEVLSDPGALPKSPDPDPATLLPSRPLNDQDVPIWNAASQTWKTNRMLRLPQDFSYIRMQGQPAGFTIDNNFRVYNWSSASTLYIQDSQGYFTNNGSQLVINKACKAFTSMQAVGPNAGNFTLGFSPVYNGVSIDSIAGSISDESHAATIQLMSSVGFTITTFNASDVINIGGFCNSGIPTVVLCMMVLPS